MDKRHKRELTIHAAAANGQTLSINELLEFDSTVIFEKNNYNETALHVAALNGKTETTIYLINKGSDVNARSNNHFHEPPGTPPSVTPLHLAAGGGHDETVLALISHDADIFAKDYLGNTPMHSAVNAGKNKTILTLLEANATLINVTNFFNETPLHQAAWYGFREMVIILLDKGADVDARCNYTNEPAGTEPSVTALHLAAGRGHIGVVRELIRHNADLFAKEKRGKTPIHEAANWGNQEIVLALLAADASLINVTTFHNETLLHVTARKGFRETVITLLDKGADVNARSNYSNEPAGTEPSVTALHLAAVYGHIEVVHELISHHADIFAKDYNGNMAIHQAANWGKQEIVLALLTIDVSLINVTNFYNETLLHCAAVQGSAETVITLLDKGADVNAKSNFSNEPAGTEPLVTALHLAAIHGHIEVVHELISHHADIFAKDYIGNMAIHQAAYWGKQEIVLALLAVDASLINVTNLYNETLLHHATVQGSAETVITLLGKGAYVNSRCNYRDEPAGTEPSVTALHMAAKNGYIDVVRELISHHADIFAKDYNGNMAIHHAATWGKQNIVLALLAIDASLINVTNFYNETLLHVTARNGLRETVITLLDKGADVNSRCNYRGEPAGSEPSVTALHMAARNGHIDVVRELISHHADIFAKDYFGDTPIHEAALGGKQETVLVLLAVDASQINFTNNLKETPLHLAVDAGYAETASALIHSKSNVDAKCYWRNSFNVTEPTVTPLHISAAKGHAHLIRILIENNASIYVQDNFGRTPLHVAVKNEHLSAVSALLKACCYSKMNVVDRNGYTPFKQAIENGNAEIVQELIKAGSDVNLRDAVGISPLEYAIQKNAEEVVKCLIKNGAKTYLRDLNDDTPLHHSVLRNNYNIVELILSDLMVCDGGCRNLISMKNNCTLTPLDLAEMHEFHNITSLLRHHRARSSIVRRNFTQLNCTMADKYQQSFNNESSSFVIVENKENQNRSKRHTISLLHGLPETNGNGKSTIGSQNINANSARNFSLLTTENFSVLHCIANSLDRSTGTLYNSLIEKGVMVFPSSQIAVNHAIEKFDSFVELKTQMLKLEQRERIYAHLHLVRPEIIASLERGLAFSGNIGLDDVLKKCKECFCENILSQI